MLFRSILIPGNDLLAVWTDPLLLAEFQLTEVAATMAAGLAGGIPLINEDEMFSLLCQLIPERCTEYPKPIVHGGFPKVQGLGQASQIKVFYTHSTVGVGYLPAFLVDKVLSLVGDVLLEHLNLVQLSVVVFGPILHIGQQSLLMGQLFRSEERRVGKECM